MSGNGKILERYTDRVGPLGGTEAPGDADGIAEDFIVFGWLRGPRDRAIMLELRKRTGNILAIPYSFIDRIAFDPSEGISLHYGHQTILIKGRNLNSETRPQIRLFQGLTRNRVPWIAEADQAAALQADKNAVMVESLEW